MIANIRNHIALAKYQFKYLKRETYPTILWVLIKQICRTTFITLKYYTLIRILKRVYSHE